MRTTKVDKAKLIKILADNRREHHEVFLEAQANYRKAAIKLLDEQLQAARDARPFELRRLVQLTAPEDHTKDYDRNIAMLQMSVDEQIELTEPEFQHYVQDEWSWSQSWAVSNISYVNRNSRGYDKLASLSGREE